MQTPSHELSRFARDVLAGLSSAPKFLSSRYFYDDEGSRLFREIMELPAYYLTRAEMRVFTEQKEAICSAFLAGTGAVDLIELGAGDGSKTAVLIDQFLSAGADITYQPIDISREANDALAAAFRRRFPGLEIDPHTGDYFAEIGSLARRGARRRVIMFLGSNIGNFHRDEAVGFFKRLRGVMAPDDRLFIGFDLQKDPRKIAAAYDDPQGVTAAFNLNLLARINRELGGDFDLSKFSHYAHYRPIRGAARSFLISREKQTVTIAALGRSFEFDKWEAVFMEISQKYTRRMIGEMAEESGFTIEAGFLDPDDEYLDSLWRPV